MCSSHQIILRVDSIYIITGDVNLHHLAKISLPGFTIIVTIFLLTYIILGSKYSPPSE